jgi:chorismate mutase
MTDIIEDRGRGFLIEIGEELSRLRADLATRTAERDALAAEVAALKPQSNANNSAPIPLKEWVIEVFQHLCHSPHTPDEWKRDLDKKTIALLDAIEQAKEAQR